MSEREEGREGDPSTIKYLVLHLLPTRTYTHSLSTQSRKHKKKPDMSKMLAYEVWYNKGSITLYDFYFIFVLHYTRGEKVSVKIDSN